MSLAQPTTPMTTHEFERFDRVEIRHLSGNATITIYQTLQHLGAIGSKGIKYSTDTDQDHTVVAEITAHSIDGRSTPMGRSLQNAVDNVPSRSSLPASVLDQLGYTTDDIKDDTTHTEVDIWIATDTPQPTIALTPPTRQTINIEYELDE